MISVTVYYDDIGYTGYEAEGHADYADEPYDIICAAASVLMINAENSICLLTDDEVKSEEHKGFVKCVFPDHLSKEGTILMDSMLIGLEQIQKNYVKYLQIEKRRKI